MNRDDLQLFMTILEENNLIKAAQQLYLSPSTAGSRLRAMEEELGYPLFERKKGVKSALPTSRGLAFSHIASQMLALWNEADQIGGMSDSPCLTIATVDSFLDYNLTPFYRELISLHGFSLDIKCYPADMIYSLVSSKQADVGFALYDISRAGGGGGGGGGGG
ncbi:MAG: LysR family transcriptional regulator, partial [Clostridia bacterium]|nr:LysR family transcriptional regulator [Clostridia bacterium]